jgi:transcriptional regulator with XRE-family HTH domain
MSLGTKLKELREKRGLSQYQVAEKLEITRSRYNSWENDIAKPRYAMLEKLCSFYNVNMDFLTSTLSTNESEKKDEETPPTIKAWLRHDNSDLTEEEKEQLGTELEDYFQARKRRILEERKKKR